MKKSVLMMFLMAICFLCFVGIVESSAMELNHIVTFDPENGTDYSSWFKTEVEDGGLVMERPQDPEKAGYQFVGWYHALDSEDNPIYWDFENDRVTDNMTLWAAYVKKHLVVFDPDDGSSYPTWFKTEVEEGGLVMERPQDPEKIGYRFVGWYHALDSEDNPIYWDFENDRVADNTTLWAAYVKKHLVAFDPDDGSSYPTWFKTEVEDGGLVMERAQDPEKVGHKFVGWYHALDSEDNPIYWDFENDRVNDNTTLWAGYVKVYLVTFNPQNGTPENEWMTLSVDAGDKIDDSIPEPKKAGYRFLGWSKKSQEPIFWIFTSETVNEDCVLYGMWEKEKEITPETGETVPSEQKNTTVLNEPKDNKDDSNRMTSTKESHQPKQRLPQTGTTSGSLYICLAGFLVLISVGFLGKKSV